MLQPAPPLPALEREVRSVAFAVRGVMPFGSWRLHVQSTSSLFLDELAFLFRQVSGDIAARSPGRGAARLHLLGAGTAPTLERFIAGMLPAGCQIPQDGFLECRKQDMTIFCTEAIRALIVAGSPPRIYFVVGGALPEYDFRVHLSLAMHTVLFHFHRMLLHAGAVKIGARVHLFVGERGSGKTTVCLKLATDGGTLLSDDHVVIRRMLRGFTLSGCSGRARVTSKTENFLGRRLDAIPETFAGILKKEFDAAELVESRPFRDYRAGAVYFLRKGRRVSLQHMPRQQAVAEFLQRTRNALRFRDKEDFRRCLDYVSAFAAQVDTFDLELGPKLADLDRLLPLLLAGARS
jgi:hypothetical protein